MLDTSISNFYVDPRLGRGGSVGRSSAAEDNIDSLIQETVARILTVENKNELSGFNVPRMVTQVKKYLGLTQNKTDVETVIRLLLRGPQAKNYLDLCRDKKDFEFLRELLAGNAETLLAQLNQRYNSDISFGSLLELRRQHPTQPLAQLLVYLVADSRPELAPYAGRLLSDKQQRYDDPHIQYVSSLQSQIKLTAVQPQEIYARTNAEDKEYLQVVAIKKNVNKKDLQQRNYKRLANLDIEKSNSPEAKLDFLKARIRAAMEVEVPA